MRTAGRTAGCMAACYRALLGLYPRRFRALFADELFGVFLQALRAAEGQGRCALWACFLRDLLDLLPNMLREYISNPEFNRMIERLLTHKEHSRWRQAGALGFAAGFGLMELATRLLAGSGASIDLPAFPLSAALISILNRPEGGMGITAFNLPGLLLLAGGGLIAGSLLNQAERPSWQSSSVSDSPAGKMGPWRLPLGGAFSMGSAYVLLYAIELTLWRVQAVIPGFFFGLLNLLSPFLYGSIVAILLGLWVRGLPGKGSLQKSLYSLGAAGVGGILFGGLAGFLWMVVVGLVEWSVKAIERFIYHLESLPQSTFLDRSLIFAVFIMVVFSAVQGWFFGGWVGNELGKGRTGAAPVTGQKPFDYALVVVGLLSIVALVSLLLIVVNR